MIKYIYIAIICFSLIRCQNNRQGDENNISSNVNAGNKIDGGRKEIEQIFYAYQIALNNNDTKTAVDCLNEVSLNYYSKLLQIVIYGDKIAIDKLRFMDKLTILFARSKFTKSEILNWDRREFYIQAFKKGLDGNTKKMSMVLGGIIFQDDKNAKGTVIMNGTSNKDIYVNFSLENGIWKLDITPFWTPLAKMMDEMVHQEVLNGSSANEILNSAFTAETGNNLNDSLWLPLKEQTN